MVFLSSVLFIDVFNLVSYPLIMKLLENEHPIDNDLVEIITPNYYV